MGAAYFVKDSRFKIQDYLFVQIGNYFAIIQIGHAQIVVDPDFEFFLLEYWTI